MEFGIWRCDYCVSGPSRSGDIISATRPNLQWTNQADFVRHLYTEHLRINTDTAKRKILQCKYGPNGVCSSGGDPSNGGCSVFFSEKDYETHLVAHHLSLSRRHRQVGISSVVVPLAALNYQEVRDDQHQLSTAASNRSKATTGSHGNSIVSNSNHSSSSHWSVYHSTVNLAALLNDPKYRQMDIFSRTWGDSFERTEVLPSPYLPPVTPHHFERYLARISTRTHPHRGSNGSSSARGRSSKPRLPSSSSEILPDVSELEAIPRMFFQSSFTLESAATFTAVLPSLSAPLSPSLPPSKGQALYHSVHDKLSHYLDTVEVHIARQISKKSSAFFEAVSSHDIVREKLTSTLEQVQKIRKTITDLNEHVIIKHMKVLRLVRQRRNYQELYNTLRLVMTVHAAQPTIQTLLSTNDFCGALDLIATTQDLLQNDLAGVHCFRHLEAQLTEMSRFVDKMVQDEFIQVVQNHFLSSDNSIEDDQLTPCVLGMLRINRLHFIISYRAEATLRIKERVKSCLLKAVCHLDLTNNISEYQPPSLPRSTSTVSMDSAQKQGQMTLAEQMRRLSYLEWIDMLEEICHGLSALIKRIVLGCSLMTTAVSRCTAETTDISLATDQAASLMEDLSHLPSQLVTCAQERIVKVVNARAKDAFMEKLTPAEFMRFTNILQDFQTQLGPSAPYPLLRSTVQCQATRLVTRFHEERRSKLTLILDNERWMSTEVPAEIQSLVTYFETLSPAPNPLSHTNGASLPADISALVIHGRSFVVAGTVLLLFKMLLEYCQCLDDIPSAASELLTRIVDLLKLFNSRTCQLVLGAGAIQLLGMKTISTRNLALASSCLQLVLFLLPAIREHFRVQLGSALHPSSQVNGGEETERKMTALNSRPLRDFDQVEKLYREHVGEIANKLVAIMEVSVSTCLSGWKVQPPVPSKEFHNICTQLTRLQKVIDFVLPEEQITELFLRIHNKLKVILSQKLRERNIVNDSGPQHGLVNSELTYYMERLRSLPGLGIFQDDFIDLWMPITSSPSLVNSSPSTRPNSASPVPPLAVSTTNQKPSPAQPIRADNVLT